MLNRILLVEDDPELSELVAEYLRGEGWTVDVVHRGEEALAHLEHTTDLAALVLDVMLPGVSGFEVLRRVRSTENPANRLPIIMLTARGDEVDRVLGLEMGADDYIPKPFSSRELAARLRALLRRVVPTIVPIPDAEIAREVLKVGDVELDMAAHSARRAGFSLDLTAHELKLLELLVRHAGTVVTREQIAQDVFGRKLLPYDRGVDTHMSNLRRKLTAENEDDPIKTLRGTGYLFTLPPQHHNGRF